MFLCSIYAYVFDWKVYGRKWRKWELSLSLWIFHSCMKRTIIRKLDLLKEVGDFFCIYHCVDYLMKVSSLSFVHRKGILLGIWGLVVSYINIFEDWICAILIEYISFHYLKNNGKYSYDYPRKEPTKLWITSTETYSLSVWDLVQIYIIIFLFY